MATLGEVYAALADYRVELQQQRFHAGAYDTAMLAESAGVSAQAAAAPLAAFSSPLTNVHATGVGVRVRGGAVVPDEFVIKVYVFNKVDLGAATDGFASLSAFIPIRFPQDRFHIPTNRFDAAIAQVSDLGAIKRGNILGIGNFATQIAAPQPGMRVTKSGRTTGVTTGVVTAVNVNNVQVNYGTQSNPRIASFNETVQIVGDDGRPFSAPGDSGSVILDRGSKKPVALLFAGDGRSTTACSFAGVCRDFNVMPA